MEGKEENLNLISEHLKVLLCHEHVFKKENIREFVSFLQNCNDKHAGLRPTRISELVKLMLDVLAGCKLRLDNQILLSTAMCILMKRTLEADVIDEILSECVTCEGILRMPSLFCSSCPSIVVNDTDFFRICISWSVLQCFSVDSLKLFYALNLHSLEERSVSPFLTVFFRLEKHCNSFTNVTFISFRMIPTWLNRMEELFSRNLTDEVSFIFYLKKVIHIVNCNWENSLTGVREKCVEILRTVFTILSTFTPRVTVTNELLNLPSFMEIIIEDLPWRMKSKYLMLTALIRLFGVKKGLNKFPSIPNGLVYSLSFPHLVSSGADCYREIIKEVSVDIWRVKFYCPLKSVMVGKNRIAQSNLMSYWMLDTLKIFPFVINEMLSDLLHEVDSSSIFSAVALFRIGRSCGLLKWEQLDCDLLKNCFSHIREDVRGAALSCVCGNTKLGSIPSRNETEMVCSFLEENVNVDSSKLRQVTLTSFKAFICRMREVSPCRVNEGCTVVDEENVVGFFLWLLKFVTGNFVPGANYQRRITSLHLLKIVLDTICVEVHEKSGQTSQGAFWLRNRISQDYKGAIIFSLLLKCLQDLVSDVRDAASVILKKHFELPSEDLFPKLWEKALGMCSSSMFYVIESGAVLAESLMYWRLRSGGSQLEGVCCVEVLLSLAEGQKAELEANVVKGAASAPVHGILHTVCRLVSSAETLAHFGLELAHVKRLLVLIESLIAFALGALSSAPDSDMDVSPSFAEMGIAVDGAVSERCSGAEELHGASELVLNCLWLNLKVCCMMACALSSHLPSQTESGPLMDESDVEHCGRLLIRVLMKCRHKGVIESAGKYLSAFALSCASNTKLSALPLKLLHECLEKTFAVEGQASSVTRRSAGLSILVHKLILADGKNTVPMSIPKLLSCARREFSPDSKRDETVDLPQAQALHFLRAIVQDSSVHQYVSPYMTEITLACFKNLSSEVWAIRNAALQLFGAVVPKLVGQKKGQEEDIVGSSVTVEELNAHHPTLLPHVLANLKQSVSEFSKSAVAPPSLLPVLGLCSRLTLGLTQMHSAQSFTQLLLEFQSQFALLLSSPSVAVRCSSAKAVSAFTPLHGIFSKIESLTTELREGSVTSENELHGKLLCIKTLRDRLEIDCYSLKVPTGHLEEIERLIRNICIPDKYYFSRALLCQMQGFTNNDIHDVLKTVDQKSSHHPGLLLWAAASLKCTVLTCPDTNLNPIIETCLRVNEYLLEAALESLTKRLEEDPLAQEARNELFLSFHKACNSSTSIQVIMHCLLSMHQLCLNSSITLPLNETEALYKKFVPSSNFGIGCSSAALSTISCLIVRMDHRGQNSLAVKIARGIHELSLPHNLEEIRVQAVRNLMYFLPFIISYQKELVNDESRVHIDGEIISSLLTTAILLLQDENVEVRTETAKFVSSFATHLNILCAVQSINPHKCINLLLTQTMLFLPPRLAVKFLWDLLSCTLKSYALLESNKAQHIKNPFECVNENIFSEKVLIAMTSGESLKYIITSGKCDLQEMRSVLPTDISSLFEMGTTLLSLGDRGEMLHANSEIYHTFMSIKYKLEITILLGMERGIDLQSILSKLERMSLHVM